jgi:hypothetical protein
VNHEAKDAPRARFYGAEGKEGVQITVDDATGAGQVGVFEAGKPRARMKGANDAGMVSMVHNDGHTRAYMHSSEHDGGQIAAITPDMKVGVKLTSGPAQGGFIAVNRPNEKPAVRTDTGPSPPKSSASL